MVKTRLYSVVMILGLLPLLLVACRPASTPALPPAIEEPERPTLSNPPTIVEPEELALPTTLKRDYQLTPGRSKFDNTGLAIGKTAVNFTLRDIYGTEFRLSRLLAEKPVMMVFGSFT